MTLDVIDRGPGIPPEEREHIFERFHRGAAAGSEGGFGLGLAIGRELARRMGGDLELADSYGRGARFVLSLRAAATFTRSVARTGFGRGGVNAVGAIDAVSKLRSSSTASSHSNERARTSEVHGACQRPSS